MASYMDQLDYRCLVFISNPQLTITPLPLPPCQLPDTIFMIAYVQQYSALLGTRMQVFPLFPGCVVLSLINITEQTGGRNQEDVPVLMTREPPYTQREMLWPTSHTGLQVRIPG